jgi:hypothetical protein
MKRLLIIVPIVLLLVVFTSFFSGRAYAQGGPPPILGFHIENQMLHCIDKFLPCNTPSTAANSLYTNVEVDKFAAGVTHGTPDAVNLVCGHAYFDQNNFFHIVAQSVSAGFEPGTIKGNVELEGDYSLTSTHAIGEIEHVVAYDSVTGDTAWVNGRIVTNNVTNLRVSGGFDLTVKGPVYDIYTDASGTSHVTVVGSTTTHCNSRTTYVQAPFATGPYFIATIGAPPGP